MELTNMAIDLTKGKVTSIKKSWVVRAKCVHHDHPLHEEFGAREQAREFKKTLNRLGNWERIKMYRAVEVTFGNGSVILTMDPAR